MKKILIYNSGGGLGDTIQQMRYIPYLRRVDNMASIAFTHTHISAQQQPQKNTAPQNRNNTIHNIGGF